MWVRACVSLVEDETTGLQSFAPVIAAASSKIAFFTIKNISTVGVMHTDVSFTHLLLLQV